MTNGEGTFQEESPVTLSAAQKKFIAVDLGVVAGLFNFLLNYGIAWALFRKNGTVPLWGQESIGGDSLVTALILTWLTALIVSRTTALQINKGNFAALPLRQASTWVRELVARAFWVRGLGLGVLAALLIALPAMLLLQSLGVQQMPAASFLWFKASFAALLALIVTPMLGWLAMHR